jgi:hypothetical protein
LPEPGSRKVEFSLAIRRFARRRPDAVIGLHSRLDELLLALSFQLDDSHERSLGLMYQCLGGDGFCRISRSLSLPVRRMSLPRHDALPFAQWKGRQDQALIDRSAAAILFTPSSISFGEAWV